MNYKPLPDGLYIGMSSIEGQGLYTDRALTKGCQLGESHYRIATNDVPSKNTEENKSILIISVVSLVIKKEKLCIVLKIKKKLH